MDSNGVVPTSSTNTSTAPPPPPVFLTYLERLLQTNPTLLPVQVANEDSATDTEDNDDNDDLTDSNLPTKRQRFSADGYQHTSDLPEAIPYDFDAEGNAVTQAVAQSAKSVAPQPRRIAVSPPALAVVNAAQLAQNALPPLLDFFPDMDIEYLNRIILNVIDQHQLSTVEEVMERVQQGLTAGSIHWGNPRYHQPGVVSASAPMHVMAPPSAPIFGIQIRHAPPPKVVAPSAPAFHAAASSTRPATAAPLMNRDADIQRVREEEEEGVSLVDDDDEAEQFCDMTVANLKQVFPDISIPFARARVEQHLHQGFRRDQILTVVSDMILEKGYEREEIQTTARRASEKRNFFDVKNEGIASTLYCSNTEAQLCDDFVRVAVKTIRAVYLLFKGYYTPSYFFLRQLVYKYHPKYAKEMGLVLDGEELKPPLEFTAAGCGAKLDEFAHFSLNAGRRAARLHGLKEPQFERELEYVRELIFKESEKLKQARLEQHEEELAEANNELLECGCCYDTEAIFGNGKSMILNCMTANCGYKFARSQILRALPSELHSKFEERLQEEALTKADLDGLIHCPFCPYCAIASGGDGDNHVLKCENPACGKESCILCKAEWKDHFGKKCKEVEGDAQTKVRTSIEERMSEAKIRFCPKCKVGFTKESGCNKMTCSRCSTLSCYICRILITPQIGYAHFCQHPREPGKNCLLCNNCSLFSDPVEDDNRALAEIQSSGLNEYKKIAPVEATVAIGPQDVTEKVVAAPQHPGMPMMAQLIQPPIVARRRRGR